MKQQDHSTPWIDTCPLPIPDALTWKIERILNHRDHNGDSYSRLANPEHVRRCDFCDQLILPCVLANDHAYDANVSVDQQKLWVNIWQPHACEYSIRYAEFLRSETEE